MESMKLSMVTLRKATDGFSRDRIIGQGSFGVVYKGKLDNGQAIAVKKFHEVVGKHAKFFDDEVKLLGMVNHANIVRLIGYCSSTEGKFICFEYLGNLSLDKHIYGELDWNKRFGLINGICRGLLFLHEQDKPIIHADLKPENILLGNSNEPKIADFGLSRLFGDNQTHLTSLGCMGSVSYMSPEHFRGGKISKQSDVYSLGILIIEITTGERNMDQQCGMGFLKSVFEHWTREHIEWRYPSLGADGHDQVERCIEIARECVNVVRDARPPIANIVEIIEEIGAP